MKCLDVGALHLAIGGENQIRPITGTSHLSVCIREEVVKTKWIFTDNQILILWAPEFHALVVGNVKGYLTLDQSSSVCAGNSVVFLYVQGQIDYSNSWRTYPTLSPPAFMGPQATSSSVRVSLCQWDVGKKRLSPDIESDIRSPPIKAVWGLNCVCP